MVPSEAEIEARLAELRRRREAIDREIADHLLYLELGRRLRAGPAPAAGDPAAAGGPRLSGPDGRDPAGARPASGLVADAAPSEPRFGPRGDASGVGAHGGRGWAAPAARPLPAAPAARGAGDRADEGTEAGWADEGPFRAPAPGSAPVSVAPSAPARPGPEGAPPPVPFDEDPAAARRYGRALVEAAVAVLAEAGRPMHAGEILERLAARGFVVPGQDPVAALNTRLWKRSAPGGPLRRLGDAVYARAGEPGPAGFEEA